MSMLCRWPYSSVRSSLLRIDSRAHRFGLEICYISQQRAEGGKRSGEEGDVPRCEAVRLIPETHAQEVVASVEEGVAELGVGCPCRPGPAAGWRRTCA
jgi:hypothetical protein